MLLPDSYLVGSDGFTGAASTTEPFFLPKWALADILANLAPSAWPASPTPNASGRMEDNIAPRTHEQSNSWATNAEAGSLSVTSTLTLSIGHAANDIYMSFLAPLLPLFITSLGLSHTQAGLLTVLKQIPSLLQPSIGHLADRFNLRPLAILAPTVTALSISMLGVAANYRLLAMLLILAGTSSVAFHSIAPAIAGELSSTQNMGRNMGLWIFGGEFGFSLGPLLIVSVVARFGLGWMPWLAFIGILGSLVLYLRLRDAPRSGVRSVASLPWQRALIDMRFALLPLLALGGMRALALSAISSYLPTYLSEAGASFWLAGASLTVYQAAASLGVLAGGSLSDRYGRHAVMLGSMVLTPLFLLLFLNAQGLAQFLTLLAVGFAIVAFDPAALAIVQESAARNRALASSVYMALSLLIRSAAVVLVGLLGDWLGLRWAFAVGALLFLLGAPLVWLLPARHSPDAGSQVDSSPAACEGSSVIGIQTDD